MKTRALHSTFLLMLSLGLTSAPSVAGATEESGIETTKSSMGGFGGTIIYENSVGGGTFTGGGEFTDRPLWTMLFSIRPKWTFLDQENLKLTLGLRQDIDTYIVDNADSLNARDRQTNVYDTRLSLSWSGYEIKPAWLTVSSAFELFLPTSRLSQLQSKILGARLYATATFQPLSWLALSYQIYGTKNFNKYTNQVLDPADFSIAPLTRAGGNEAVADGVALATGNPEWSLANRGTLELTFLEKFTFTIDFVYTQVWNYQSFAIDALSSPHAVAGRGYTDLTDGTLELSYAATSYLDVALGTVTEQLPKTADNKGFRFPFWDTSNGAENRQTFYLDVVGKF